MVFAGRWQDKVGPRAPALVGMGLLTIGSLFAAQVHAPQQLPLWVVSYGLVYGAGIGFCYVCPIAALAKWFPDIKGLITGIAVAGFGGGAAFFIPNVKAFLGHMDTATKTWIPVHHVADLFLIHAGVCALVVTIGALLLCNPPQGWTPPLRADAGPVKPKKPAAADVEPTDMLAMTRFWLLWTMFLAGSIAGLMTISFAAAIAGAGAASALAVFNACGRVGWGAVSDRVGRERAMAGMFIIQCLVMLTLAAANKGLQPNSAVSIALMGLVGLNFGGCLAVFPSATSDAFGTRNLGINYGLVFTAYGTAGVVGPLIAAYFKDSVKSYTPAFIVAAALVGLATVGAVVCGRLARPAPAEIAAE